MIVKLRRNHFYLWLLLAIVIPVGIIISYINIKPIERQSLETTSIQALANVVANKQGEFTLINLRESGSVYQVEAVILKPIQAANVMLKVKSGNSDITLGRLGNKGVHRFNLPNDVTINGSVEISLYDQIKNQELEKISIQL